MEVTLALTIVPGSPQGILLSAFLTPQYIEHATTSFDNLLREALEELAGGPLLDWAGRKA